MLVTPKMRSIISRDRMRFGEGEDTLPNSKRITEEWRENSHVAADLQDTLNMLEKKIENFKQGLVDSQDKIKDEVEKNSLDQVKKNMGATANKLNPQTNKLLFILHDNWSLMASMMMGIQKSVFSLSNETGTIGPKDFTTQYTFDLRPVQVSSKDYEINRSYKKSVFYDYAPFVFNEIRKLFGINPKTVESYEQVPDFSRNPKRA